MEIQIKIDATTGTYFLEHKTDGIYVANLVCQSNKLVYNYPKEIIFIRQHGTWKSDHYQREVAEKLIEKLNRKVLD